MPTENERQELAKKSDLLTKQDTLIAGTGISIAADGKTISATGTGGSTVEVTPIQLTGTRIAAMTIDGNIISLYAPTPPTVSATQVVQSGVEVARITINGSTTSIYAPEGTAVLSGTSAPTAAQGENGDLYVQYTVTSSVYTVDMTYVKLSGEWVELSAGGGGGGNVDDVYVNGTSVLDSNKIAQIVSYKEVTQAEYDALPASKLTDNILYCIKDKATADTTVAPVIYSEEEREIGVYADGKPLYQKTISLTNVTLNVGNTNVDVSYLNADKIIGIIDGYAVYGTTTIALPFGLGGSYPIAMTASSNSSITIVRGGSSLATTLIQFTVRYTKTTDQPGSGKYAPSGVPAVHYSTYEQAIGTWIDGSPIYQKTFTFTSLSGSTSGWTNLTSFAGVDNMISMTGHIINSNSSQQLSINSRYIATTYLDGYLKYACESVSSWTFNMFLTVQYTKSTS